jgi:formate-dependent nitrite reductase membrane component NrfD
MTIARPPRGCCQMMPWLLTLYAVASLVHFTHNAEYLAQYPNLPAAWTRADVYLAWCGVTAIGLSGFVLYRVGYRRVGLLVLAIYSGFGFDGLLHYTRAPMAHHSLAMNVTIWAEVVAAALFLISLSSIAIRNLGSMPRQPPNNRWRGP